MRVVIISSIFKNYQFVWLNLNILLKAWRWRVEKELAETFLKTNMHVLIYTCKQLCSSHLLIVPRQHKQSHISGKAEQ